MNWIIVVSCAAGWQGLVPQGAARTYPAPAAHSNPALPGTVAVGEKSIDWRVCSVIVVDKPVHSLHGRCSGAACSCFGSIAVNPQEFYWSCLQMKGTVGKESTAE